MWGIIDSGFGGISIIKEIKKQNKNIDFIYFGDTYHNPYGLKTEIQILNRINKIINFLVEKYKIKKILIACNTASIVYLKYINYFNKKSVRIEPITKITLNYLNNKKICDLTILATEFTVKSNFYKNSLYIINDIQQINAQIIVEMIEKNINYKILKEILKSIKNKYVLLGCTHFYFIKNKISKDIKIIDPSKLFVKYNIKKTHRICNNNIFLTTGDIKHFYSFLKEEKINDISLVNKIYI